MLLALMALAPAHAQGVVNGDFETGDLTGWNDQSWETDLKQPTHDETLLWSVSGPDVRGSHAAEIWKVGTYGLLHVFSDPFTVTHTEISYARIDNTGGNLDLVVDTEAGRFSAHVAGPASTDAFTNWVVPLDAAACGGSAVIEVDDPMSFQFEIWTVDDFALSGPICTEYLDDDGDGLCPRGTDLDADGSCIDAGEQSTTDEDCDDNDAAVTTCMKIISAPHWWDVSEPYKVVVAGANPLETVRLVASPVLGQICPPRLGGHCLELDQPMWRAGSVQADGAGVAVFDVPVPSGVDPWGMTVYFEAVAERGPLSISSAVAQTMTRPGTGPLPSPGWVNGDVEGGTPGWSEIAGSWEDNSYSWNGCPDGLDLVSSERGTSLNYTIDQPDYCGMTDRSWPSLVTHEVLAHARTTSRSGIDIIDAATDTEISGPELTRVAPDGWTESLEDLSAHCGAIVYLELGHADPDAMLDDVQWAGPVCPQFEDLDGDGLCTQGIDLDGDGTCVDAGEHGPDVPVIEPLEVVFADHEDGTLQGWSGELVTWADLAPTYPGSGTHGAVLDTTVAWFADWYRSPGPLVTHDTFAVSLMFEGTGDYSFQSWTIQVITPDYDERAEGWSPLHDTLVFPATWGQRTVDLSEICGLELTDVVMTDWEHALYIEDPWSELVAADRWYVDDMGLTGDPCPIFVDYDGDGLCSEGIDLDLDGLCVDTDAGEPTPGVVQDPNEPIP